MKFHSLLLALFLTTSCLKKAEEAAKSSDKSSDSKENSKTEDETEENNKSTSPLVGKWKFTLDERGMKITSYNFVKIKTIPTLLPTCANEESYTGQDLTSIYLDIHDEKTFSSYNVYATCTVKEVKINYTYNLTTGEFLAEDDENEILMKVDEGKLFVKMNNVQGTWDYNYTEYFAWNFNNQTYTYQFKKTDLDIKLNEVALCDDNFNYENAEFKMYYEFYLDNSYKEFDTYYDSTNNQYCVHNSWDDLYNFEDDIFTFISDDSSWTVDYDLLFQNDQTEFYLKDHF
jgi:hypothetical protein